MTSGCGGVLTLRFTDNVLVDIPGFDLYVFEIGPMTEPSHVEISADGDRWIDIGNIEGGTAAIDIGPHVKAADIFRYVRLTDLKSDCDSAYPGADIDAVGAIGASALADSLVAALHGGSLAAALSNDRRRTTIDCARQVALLEGDYTELIRLPMASYSPKTVRP